MDLQPTYNKFGSPLKFYRFQTKNSGTTYDPRFGFLAGDYYDAEFFECLDYDEQRSIVEDHSNWSIAKASPFISTTSDLAWAQSVAKRIRWPNPIYIAEISPGRAVSGSIRYYHWSELVRELDANIEHKARNYHETVFLGQIPQEAVTWYGTVEESERHCFEDEEEDQDFEQEQEEYEEDDEDEDGDGEEIDSLLNLMSQFNIEGGDEHESEVDRDEAEEWFNQLAEADSEDQDYYEPSFWEDLADFDLQSEDDLYDL